MGLGIRFGSRLKRSWFQFKAPDVREQLSAIERAAKTFMQTHGLETIYRPQFTDEGLEIFLHPVEEPLRFSQESDYLVVSGKTSSAGPGYHAFVIELLDHVAAACNLTWLSDLDGEGFCDETGYVKHRDVGLLQEAMTDQLAALAKYVRQVDSDGMEHFNLSLPLGFEVKGDYFCISGLGYWPRTFFDNPEPERFYPWWEPGLNAKALAGMAICKLWTDIRWRPAMDDEERRDLIAVKSLSARARQIDPSIDLPVAVLDEVDLLLAGHELPEIDPEKIGFRRHPMKEGLTGDWFLFVPGYFYRRFDPGSGQLSFWYGGRSVHVTTFNFEPRKLELVWPTSRASEPEAFRFETVNYRGIATLRPHKENGTSGWLMQAICNSFESVAVVSVLFTDEKDQAWAEDVLRTLDIRLPEAMRQEPAASVH